MIFSCIYDAFRSYFLHYYPLLSSPYSLIPSLFLRSLFYTCVSFYVLVLLASLQGKGLFTIYKSIGIPTVSVLLKKNVYLSPSNHLLPIGHSVRLVGPL